jgi:hypothetical protein
MRRPQVVWIAVALLGLGTLLVIAVALRTVSTDPRNGTVERIVAALDQRGVRCAGLSIDQSPADEPIVVNAEGRCTADGRQLRVVIVAATDRATRDRYLHWLHEQGGGGYFAMGETWAWAATSSGWPAEPPTPSAARSASLPTASAPRSIGNTSAPSPSAAHPGLYATAWYASMNGTRGALHRRSQP